MSSLICPRAILLDECICDDDELSHGGGDGDFGEFSVLAEVLVEGFDGGIDADGDDGSHVERAACGYPSALDVRLSAPFSAVAVHRGDTGEDDPSTSLRRAIAENRELDAQGQA
jgi:hypothetical protein